MKICPTCKQDLPDTSFYPRYGKDADKLQSKCKTCFSQYCMQRWIKIKVRAIDYLGGKCEDCGKKYPTPVYDFHHKDPTQKEYTWQKLRLRAWKSIEKELDKCELLCSNCHRLRHAGHY